MSKSRLPGAVWRPIPRNYTGGRKRTDAVILHVAASEAKSLHGWFSNPDARASSHFYVTRDGRTEQYVAGEDSSWTSGAGSWRSIGVETQGMGEGRWTEAQLDALARICAWAHTEWGVPLTAMRDSKPSSKGIGYHRLGVPGNIAAGGERWSKSRGKTCPGPERIPQVPEVIRRAQALVKGAPVVKPAPTSTAAPTLTPDGWWGDKSAAALRRLVKASSDTNAVRYLQGRLNATGWSKAVLGRDLVTDGVGLWRNATDRRVSETMRVWFAALDEDPKSTESTATGYFRAQWHIGRGRLWNYAHTPTTKPTSKPKPIAPAKPKPVTPATPVAPRTAQQAVAWAKVRRRGFGGLCLSHVRQAWGIPGKYAGARLAWEGAKLRHPQNHTKGIPVGAPIFLDRPGSTWGHVATWLGGGLIATTDSVKGITQVEPVRAWTHGPYRWRILGWTEDLNGHRLNL